MSHYTLISLSRRSVQGLCGQQAWLKQDLLFSAYSDVCFIMPGNGMCMFTCAVWMCSCASEQVYVVSVVVWTGHGECARSAVCFLPSFARLPLLCSALPSFQSLLSKISSNLTSLCWWSPREDVKMTELALLCEVFLILLIDSITQINLNSCDSNKTQSGSLWCCFLSVCRTW